MVFAADKPKAKPDADLPAWEQPQPAVEDIDYTMYSRIREEGLLHSHIMEYGSALADAIGPRLTAAFKLGALPVHVHGHRPADPREGLIGMTQKERKRNHGLLS